METTEEVGHVSHFLIDAKNHQVEGFVCKQGLLGFETVPVMWVQLESVGQDSILVRRSGTVISERLDAAIALDKQAVWSDAGDQVGQLVDYCLDLSTGAITQYLFTAPGWQGLTEGIYTFTPAAVVSTGKKRIMVRQAALEQAAKFVPGVQDRVKEAWQQDIGRTRQDVQGAINNSREVAEQVQTQAQKLTEQARSQFGQVLARSKSAANTCDRRSMIALPMLPLISVMTARLITGKCLATRLTSILKKSGRMKRRRPRASRMCLPWF